MNTPTHIAASLLTWRKEERASSVIALVIGGFLPDLPMFGFYAYQRFFAGSSEREIWTTLYFEPGWQLLFDLFNSIPLTAVLMAVFWKTRFRFGMLLCASVLLHQVCDLPVHHDDAHRHFLPLTNWRFESPISYWDPAHYGLWFAAAELVFAIAAIAYIGSTTSSLAMRIAAWMTFSLYALAVIAGLVFWAIISTEGSDRTSHERHELTSAVVASEA